VIIIGVTGGIGGGKTTFCNYFIEKGIPVLIADELGHTLIEEDNSVRNQILDKFGNSIVVENKINRKKLADLVFNDQTKLKQLNKIIHPAVINLIKKKVNTLKVTSNFILIESALLPNSILKDECNYIISVLSEMNLRIKRKQKDNLTKGELSLRIEQQPTEKEFEKCSDFIITNNGSLSEFKNQAEFYFNLFSNLTEIK